MKDKIKNTMVAVLVIMLLLGAGSESEYFPVFNLICTIAFCLLVMCAKRQSWRKRGEVGRLIRSLEIRERTENRVRSLRGITASRLSLFWRDLIIAGGRGNRTSVL